MIKAETMPTQPEPKLSPKLHKFVAGSTPKTACLAPSVSSLAKTRPPSTTSSTNASTSTSPKASTRSSSPPKPRSPNGSSLAPSDRSPSPRSPRRCRARSPRPRLRPSSPNCSKQTRTRSPPFNAPRDRAEKAYHRTMRALDAELTLEAKSRVVLEQETLRAKPSASIPARPDQLMPEYAASTNSF